MQTLPRSQQDVLAPAAFLFLREFPGDPASPGVPQAAEDPAVGVVASPDLLCAQCLHPITAEAWRMAVAGSHRHVFANPGGLVFEIGCFSSAPGCAALGPPTPDFSWFSGTLWQVAVCAACGLHLGWRYEQATSGLFFGLILDRLRQASNNLV